MSGRRTIEAVAALSLAAAGCQLRPPAYVEPPPQAPHAVVKIRVVHHAQPGPMRSASLELNGNSVELPPQPEVEAAATRSLRIRPEAAAWRLATEFFHTQTRTESYQATEQYACGTTRIGNSTSTQYCSRSVTRSRVVTDHITDASCRSDARLAAQAGGMYLLQYDFFGHGECSLKCFVQTPGEGGEFALSPCPEPQPAPADTRR